MIVLVALFSGSLRCFRVGGKCSRMCFSSRYSRWTLTPLCRSSDDFFNLQWVLVHTFGQERGTSDGEEKRPLERNDKGEPRPGWPVPLLVEISDLHNRPRSESEYGSLMYIPTPYMDNRVCINLYITSRNNKKRLKITSSLSLPKMSVLRGTYLLQRRLTRCANLII